MASRPGSSVPAQVRQGCWCHATHTPPPASSPTHLHPRCPPARPPARAPARAPAPRSARATVCDISATSLRQLLAAAEADGIDARRVTAFVADAADPGLRNRLSSDPADVALIMFTLSAVPPGAGAGGMWGMLANAAAALRPGGRLCVRDHGLGDMVQLRIPPEQVVFAGDVCSTGGGPGGAAGQRSGGAPAGWPCEGSGGGGGGGVLAAPGGPGFGCGSVWYRRGDGTLAYFFTPDELAAMGAAAGLGAERCDAVCVVNANRRTGQALRRVFVQAQFVKPPGGV